ncbi:oxidoreductase [Novosphingobium sp. PC22D]|uniref:oxidoreductase n=1 Tax=Novosphingobium sp. PC22D TaxID=1962403 RepID=UPI000BEF9910|nr:oxidoreductase [Novosphingobium sp. PC22D]PEQ13310.1 oxidoreductase [Novosphingobium sp. PC22D]
MKGFTAADVPDLAGKCVMVTGANTGIGFEAAKVLAARHARVLLACRSEDRASAAMDAIRREVPAADLAFVALDQADLESVRACAAQIADEPRLDVLLNNAGVMFPPLTRTAQGHELQFGVNHLGTFALTGLLLPKLTQSPGARVVVTASLAHWSGDIKWDDLDAHRSYERGKRYSDSKLMNLLFAHELDRRLRAAGSPVSAMACHPGVAATELVRHLPWIARATWPIVNLLLNTPAQGAWPALQAATDSGAQPGGYYGPRGFRGTRGDSGLSPRSKASREDALAERLWKVSVEMTGIDPDFAAR